MELNIFELSSRQKTRIATNRGPQPAEVLWDMPLTSKGGFDLDTVGQAVIAELEGLGTRSLVKAKPNPRIAELELQLALIKHVIDVKEAEKTAAAARAERAAEREKLMEQLAKKQDAKLEGLTEDEIKARLRALDA
jgi:hypothetical protein